MKLFNIEFILLLISTFSIILLIINIMRKSPIKQLQKAFLSVLLCVLIISIGVILQLICTTFLNIEPIFFEKFIYIGTCMLPVALFFTASVFKNTKIRFKKRYLLLFVIPILTLIIICTNSYHHLFYKTYSSNLNEMEFGTYFYVHTIYTYALLFISILIMINVSLKNSGIFSKQTLFIIIGTMFPILINLLGTFKIIRMNVCLTPISFTIAVMFYTFAILKFNFLNITPIALRKIVDRISDSYVVLGDDNNITDFNQTFLDRFGLEDEKIRGKNLIEFLKHYKISSTNINKIQKYIIQASNNNGKTISFEQKFEQINKYFRIEITRIDSEGSKLGILFLLKDITQHKEDMETIRNNQDILMERERLASLGQLIAGIAHNLKTPIMSIAGATEALEELIKEYDDSIDDPLVTHQDHHDIAKDMESWIPKIRTHIEYMSDIITTVKGQAVAFSNDEEIYFSVGELVKRVDILMKHELKNAYIYLNVLMKIDENLELRGDVNSLVQVVNNMISNAIQAYAGEKNKSIELEVNKKGKDVIISVTDFAGGLPKEVQEKLFKEMVTTKGKNGTGLGLYMSYSNIKARFGGDITYETEEGKGTRFNISIPIKR